MNTMLVFIVIAAVALPSLFAYNWHIQTEHERGYIRISVAEYEKMKKVVAWWERETAIVVENQDQLNDAFEKLKSQPYYKSKAIRFAKTSFIIDNGIHIPEGVSMLMESDQIDPVWFGAEKKP